MQMMCAVQPGQRPAPQFMVAPAAIPGVPPGLEYLAQIDQLLVHQQIEIFECMYIPFAALCVKSAVAAVTLLFVV